MAVNVTQHDAFGPPINKFMDYVTAASTLEQYDGMKIRALVDGFGEILRVHLNDEIPTLLALNKYGGEKLKEAWDMLEKRIQKDMMKSNLVCSPSRLHLEREANKGKTIVTRCPFRARWQRSNV